jgi:hypothetical protein
MMKKEPTLEKKYALWKNNNDQTVKSNEVKNLLKKIGDTRGSDDCCDCCTSG